MAEFGVNNADKSAMTPILDTTVSRSSGLDHLPHDLLHLRGIFFSQLDASSRGRLQINDELAGIGSWKKRNANKREEKKAQQEHPDKSDDDFPRVIQRLFYPFLIDIQHLLEADVEPGVKSRAPGQLLPFVLPCSCTGLRTCAQ